MTIKEAIEILDTHQCANPDLSLKLVAAINLGIEGLKRLLGDREAIPADKFFRLPGETDK